MSEKVKGKAAGNVEPGRPKKKRKKLESVPGIEGQRKGQMALGRKNFIMMAASGLFIVVGFLLMLGPSSTVDSFEPDIFSTRRIVVGPLLAFLGFVAMGFAIIYRPKKKVIHNS